jgi:hypothetical protein
VRPPQNLTENVKVGNKDWRTVWEGEGQDIDARFAALEGRVAMLEQDLIRTVGRPQVHNVAGQLLAWVLKNQPRTPRNSTSFSAMAAAGYRLLSSACPPNLSVQRFAELADQVSDQRNASIHYPTWPALRQAVTEMLDLAARHPDLQILCEPEFVVLDNADRIVVAFGLR